MIAIRSGVFRSQRGEQPPKKFSPKIHLVGRFKIVVLFLKISGLSIRIQKFHVICGNTCISEIVCSSTCTCKEICTYVKEELCTWTHSVVWFTVLTAFAPQTPAVPDAREKLITMLIRCTVCDRITEELRVVWGIYIVCVTRNSCRVLFEVPVKPGFTMYTCTRSIVACIAIISIPVLQWTSKSLYMYMHIRSQHKQIRYTHSCVYCEPGLKYLASHITGWLVMSTWGNLAHVTERSVCVCVCVCVVC